MWVIIMTVIVIALAAGIFYLVNRICKFRIIEKLSKENSKKRTIIASLIVISLFIILMLSIDIINAVIIYIHFIFSWIVFDLIGLITGENKKQLKFYRTGTIAIIVTIAWLIYGWISAHNVVKTEYDIQNNKNSENLRVVEIADSHICSIFDGSKLSEYMQEIQKSEPDILIIAGDLVDDGTSLENMILTCKALGEIKTTYGVYFSFGNHDKGYSPETRKYGAQELSDELEKNGVTVLEDEKVFINDDFCIIGRQDRSEKSRMSAEKLMDGIDKNVFTIMIDHQPGDYSNEAKSKVNLVLSGHTHGGQLMPVTRVGEWFGINDRTYGYEQRDETNFIVTSGIADWEIKFKTGCIAEYVVANIKGN